MIQLKKIEDSITENNILNNEEDKIQVANKNFSN